VKSRVQAWLVESVPGCGADHALADAEDVRRLSEHDWFIDRFHQSVFGLFPDPSRAHCGGKRRVLLKHAVLNWISTRGCRIDHADGDFRNCRKSNLVVVKFGSPAPSVPFHLHPEYVEHQRKLANGEIPASSRQSVEERLLRAIFGE
jgi:hypothetical protein